MRGALVGFCGLTAAGKAWIKDYFSPEVSVDGRTVWADWRIAQPKRLGLSDRLYRGDWLAMVPTSQAGGPKSRRRIVLAAVS